MDRMYQRYSNMQELSKGITGNRIAKKNIFTKDMSQRKKYDTRNIDISEVFYHVLPQVDTETESWR